MNSQSTDSPLDHFSKPEVPDHELIKCIGRGSFGQVWLARTITGSWRAIKIIRKTADEDELCFMREYEGLQKYEPVSRKCPSLVAILHAGRNDIDGYFYYSMELADSFVETQPIDPQYYKPMTLRSRLRQQKRLSLAECIQIGLNLSQALDELHRHDLVHRDIKPSNIIFINGIPKLADIGLVTQMDSTVSFVGTEGYVAPEGPGTIQSDIYSLGKLLYEISTGLDRKKYPELPADLPDIPDKAQFLAFHKIIEKACYREPQKRYRSAVELTEDLKRLLAGKPMQQSLALSSIVGAFVLSLLLVTGLLVFLPKWISSRKITSRPPDLSLSNNNQPQTGAAPLTPIRITNDPVTRVANSKYHSCAVLKSGRLVIWGDNRTGQLGNGSLDPSFYPIFVGQDTNWIMGEAGDNFTVGLKTDGTLWTWGDNSFGQLGIGTYPNTTIPTRVGLDEDWAFIYAAPHYVFAEKKNGLLWGWGRNDKGQLGIGANTVVNTPIRIGADFWQSLSGSYEFACGIKTNGTLWAWGMNMNGELGCTNLSFSYSPVQVGEESKWKSIATGMAHCLALKMDGTIWSWGDNGANQCGREPSEFLYLPIGQVGNETDWQSIGSGLHSSIALKVDGTLWNWGDDTLRRNEWQNRVAYTPINAKPVNSDRDWNWIPRLYYDTCFAIKKDGALGGWGKNGFGQLGDGTRIDRDHIVRVIPAAE